MTIFDTLTDAEKILLIQGRKVGIFETLFSEDDEYYTLAEPMCLCYYTQRSGNKTVSTAYKRIDELTKKDTSFIHPTTNQSIGLMLYAKFNEKWARIYETLRLEYSPISDMSHTLTKIGTNTDTKQYGGKITTDSKSGSYESTTTNDEGYGFNSNYAVPTAHQTIEVTAPENQNTVKGTQEKTGSDVTTSGIDETHTIEGRKVSPSKLVSQEILTRINNIFFDIVFADIDSVMALQIYI